MSRDLTYDSSTGQFTGTMVTNLCNYFEKGIVPEPWNSAGADPAVMPASAQCMEYTFPDANFDPSNSPQASPLLNTAGLTLYGVNIYSAYEAGFSAGMASCDAGSCDAGIDVATCEMALLSLCDGVVEDVSFNMFADTCGAHATPYHTHVNAACDYDTTESGHSPLIGVMLDGYGIYGLYEDTNTYPTDLDTCGGHVGPVPGTTGHGLGASDGIAGLTTSSVYHYHMQSQMPYTIGCYGSPDEVTTYSMCMEMYDDSVYSGGCTASYSLMCDCDGVEQCIDTWCPCYEDGVQNSYDAATCPGVTPGEQTCVPTNYCESHTSTGKHQWS